MNLMILLAMFGADLDPKPLTVEQRLDRIEQVLGIVNDPRPIALATYTAPAPVCVNGQCGTQSQQVLRSGGRYFGKRFGR